METVFHSSLVILSVLYTILGMGYAWLFAKGAEGRSCWAWQLLLGTIGVHAASILVRGKMVGSCPLGSPGEFLSLIAFSIALIYCFLEVRLGERTTGVFAVGLVLVLQLVATIRILGQEEQVASKLGVLRSFHSFSAVVAFSAVALCGLYGVLYLFLYGAIKAGRFGLFFRKMPSLERLGDMNFVATWVAFVALTVTVGLGASIIAGHQTEIVSIRSPEVLAVGLLWLLFGAAIAARRVFGLGGKRLAYTTVLASLILVTLVLSGFTTGRFHD